MEKITNDDFYKLVEEKINKLVIFNFKFTILNENEFKIVFYDLNTQRAFNLRWNIVHNPDDNSVYCGLLHNIKKFQLIDTFNNDKIIKLFEKHIRLKNIT